MAFARQDYKGMELGFTTGSCSAAGAKAAVYMLLTGKKREKISILTPKGLVFEAQLVDVIRGENFVSCAVVKNGGDDPDITSGAHIVSTVSLLPERSDCCAYVEIEGGKGVGKVTKPGLDQEIGSAAINKVPRKMIQQEVLEVCALCDYRGGIKVVISVPEGEELAARTFNPRLGIEGGISILGTSGVVEPMSSQALLDTIRVELNQHKALGYKIACITPGNYGLDFMKAAFGFDLEKSVKCSNFIGDTIDMARELGFSRLLLTGHIGKLVKVSGGLMNTHSKEGDCRMELLASYGAKSGCSAEEICRILDSITTEEGIRIIKDSADGENKFRSAMELMLEKIMFFLNRRGEGKIEIGCMVYSNQFGLLCKSSNAVELLEEAKNSL